MYTCVHPIHLSPLLFSGLRGSFSGLLCFLYPWFPEFPVLEHTPALLCWDPHHPLPQSHHGGPQVSRLWQHGKEKPSVVIFLASYKQLIDVSLLHISLIEQQLASSTGGCSGGVTVRLWAIRSSVVGPSPSSTPMQRLSNTASSGTISRCKLFMLKLLLTNETGRFEVFHLGPSCTGIRTHVHASLRGMVNEVSYTESVHLHEGRQ